MVVANLVTDVPTVANGGFAADFKSVLPTNSSPVSSGRTEAHNSQ